MKELFKMTKPGDYILVVFFVIISFLPLLYFNRLQSTNSNSDYTAVISVKGKEEHQISLVDDGERIEIEIGDLNTHYNKVIREGNSIWIEHANCPDQLCVEMGEIERIGQTIVCLPHQVLIEITSKDTDELPEVDAIS